MRIFGDHETRTIEQLQRCVDAAEGSAGVLCADGHVGYSQPIGGVVAYREHLSPSRRRLRHRLRQQGRAHRPHATTTSSRDLPRIMDEISRRISFGVGRNDGTAGRPPGLRRDPRRRLRAAARAARHWRAQQLGTVGAGNHYVDLFADEQDRVWVGVHFGSRGFGHKTASGFLALAQGRAFDERARRGRDGRPPVLLPPTRSSAPATWRR